MAGDAVLPYKISAIFEILLAAVIGSTLPYIYIYFHANTESVASDLDSQPLFFLLKAASCGVIIGVAILHLLPDSVEALDEEFDYPVPFALLGVGVILCLSCEQFGMWLVSTSPAKGDAAGPYDAKGELSMGAGGGGGADVYVAHAHTHGHAHAHHHHQHEHQHDDDAASSPLTKHLLQAVREHGESYDEDAAAAAAIASGIGASAGAQATHSDSHEDDEYSPCLDNSDREQSQQHHDHCHGHIHDRSHANAHGQSGSSRRNQNASSGGMPMPMPIHGSSMISGGHGKRRQASGTGATSPPPLRGMSQSHSQMSLSQMSQRSLSVGFEGRRKSRVESNCELGMVVALFANSGNDTRTLIKAYVLEAAIAVHSIIMGLSLGAMQNDEMESVKVLMIAYGIHQLLEGVSLGCALSATDMSTSRVAGLIAFFALTLPTGIVVGILITSATDDHAGVLVEGFANGVAAGILIYVSMVEMLADEFAHENVRHNYGLKFQMIVAITLGIVAMGILAIWA